MQVLIRRRMFVEDKDYLVNEKDKKYTRLGFDYIKEVCEGSFLYRLGEKINIVSYPYVQIHADKRDYIAPAIYDYVISFPNFYVLARVGNAEGVKVVEESDKQILFPTGKLIYVEEGKYAIIQTDSQICAVYCTNDGVERFAMPLFDEQFNSVVFHNKIAQSTADIFNFVGDCQNICPCNKAELDSLLNFFKLLLQEDIANCKTISKKYVLVDEKKNLTFSKLDDLSKLKIVLKDVAFTGITQAKTMANNVLKFYKYKAKLMLAESKLQQ